MISPLALPRAPASVAIGGPPQCGGGFIARAVIEANKGRDVRLYDFSTRPTTLQSNDPHFADARKLAADEHCVVLTVMHSGGSGRDIPDASLFLEFWKIIPGWPPHPLGHAQDLNGSEVMLDRGGGRPVLKLRSPDNFRTYEVIQ